MQPSGLYINWNIYIQHSSYETDFYDYIASSVEFFLFEFWQVEFTFSNNSCNFLILDSKLVQFWTCIIDACPSLLLERMWVSWRNPYRSDSQPLWHDPKCCCMIPNVIASNLIRSKVRCSDEYYNALLKHCEGQKSRERETPPIFRILVSRWLQVKCLFELLDGDIQLLDFEVSEICVSARW